MTLAYTYDGASLTHKIAPSSIEVGSRLDRGNVEEGSVVIEDPTGNLTLTGLRPFVVEESACSQPRLFTGYLASREIGRSYSATQILGASARVHEATVYDLNAIFMFRPIKGADGKRPEESWNARLAWLMASDYLADFLDDSHLISISSMMEAADYRRRFPIDVLNDLVDRTGDVTTYGAYWDPTANAGAGGVALYFSRPDDTTYQSTLKISNVSGDPNGSTVFAPTAEARLTRDPQTVYSTVGVVYANDQIVWTSRADTALTYIERGTTIDRPYTGRSSTATSQGQGWLQSHAFEADRITCTIRVPRASAGLVTAGCSMEVKFSHLPGYSAYAWMRVAFCRPKPIDDYARVYDLELELVAQREAADTSGVNCNVPGAWTASLANGATVTTTTSSSSTVSNASRVTDAVKTNASTWTAGVFSTGTYQRGWIVDLGATYEISSVTFIGGLDGDNPQTNNSYWNVLLGPDAGTLTEPAGAWTAVDLNGWDAYGGVEPTNWGKRTYRLTTAVEARYVNVRDEWASVGLNFRDSIDGFEILVEGCDPAPAPEVITNLLGADVEGETPNETPNGAIVLFSVDNPYLAGTLTVTVDNLDQTAAVTETSPAAGTFTLAFAPKAGEQVRASYKVG